MLAVEAPPSPPGEVALALSRRTCLAHKALPVFPAERGGPIRVSNLLRRRWHPLLESLKLEQCGFHRLRYPFASLVLRTGMDVGADSKMLGHASIAITTGTYAHAIPGRGARLRLQSPP